MKIISRYILVEAFTYFLVCLFAFTGVLFIARILRFTSLIVNKGVDATQIAWVFAAIIPTFLEVALPMSVLLGVMMAFGRLSGDSEIVVMRASGISLRQLIRPVVIFGLLAMALCFFVTIVLSPKGHQVLADSLFQIARSKSTAGLEDGMFNKLGRITLYADSVKHQTGQLSNVLIDDRRDATRRQIIFAQHGKIVSNPKTRTISILLNDGAIHEVVEGRYGVTDFTTNRLNINPDEMYNPEAKKGSKNVREMSMAELREHMAVTAEALQRASAEDAADIDGEKLSDVEKGLIKTHVEYGRRFAMPVAAFLLALIAMPLGIQPPRAQRTWGVTLSITLAMLIFVFYFGLMSIGLTFAENGSWPPMAGLWLPNAAVAVLTALTLWQMGTERWQSIGQVFESLFERIGRWKTARQQPQEQAV